MRNNPKFSPSKISPEIFQSINWSGNFLSESGVCDVWWENFSPKNLTGKVKRKKLVKIDSEVWNNAMCGDPYLYDG